MHFQLQEGHSLVFMYESNHAETGSAEAVAAVVVAEPRVEDEQWLVSIEYATQIPYHLFLC